jgi:ribokinase
MAFMGGRIIAGCPWRANAGPAHVLTARRDRQTLTPMDARVFVFGSINTDLVVYVERLPVPGETVSGGRFAQFPGGKGANQAVAAARAGARVELHGCLGDDAFGSERLASLRAAGVSTAGVRLVAGAASGIAQITVDRAGENTIAVAPGANLVFDGSSVAVPAARTGERAAALFQNEVPQAATESLIVRAGAAGHLVMWNLAPTITRDPAPGTLAAVDYLVCNANELAAATGGAAAAAGLMDDGEIRRRAQKLLARGVKHLLVTLGSRGSILAGPDGTLYQEAFPVESVDTVGAGDCFCGVFAAGLAAGLPVAAALRRASAGAAISTTRRGAQDSMPTGSEIDAFLAALAVERRTE